MLLWMFYGVGLFLYLTLLSVPPLDPVVAAALAVQQQTFQAVLDNQLKTFQACLQACMETQNKRLDTFVRQTVTDIAEIKTSLQYTQNELHDIKQKTTGYGDQHVAADKMMMKLAADYKRLDDAVDYLENQSRRNNLRVDGVKEKAGETWEETEASLRQVFQRELQIPQQQVDALRIERAHRTGTANTQRDRTIVVKFDCFKDRDAILRAARTVKPRGTYLNEDYSQRAVARRKELIPAMKDARERGKIAYLSFDKLVVKDRQAH